MKEVPTICIDGLSAAGKSSIARLVGRSLSFNVLNSGVLYRTLALLCFDRFRDETLTMAKLLSFFNCVMPSVKDFIVSKDWSQEGTCSFLNSERIGLLASKISTIPQVRTSLLSIQRLFSKDPGLVAEGRDMGAVVFPKAQLKAYATSPLMLRCRRRGEQLKGSGVSSSEVRRVAETIIQRDSTDEKLFARTKPTMNKKCHKLITAMGSAKYQAEKIMNLFMTLPS
ncbi:cytidylate kinase [Candidatus Tremblaya phenacola PAVE]|nr:cytidylate kinase [Candidatus Tremblaya phenacola PAVE]